MNAAPMPDDFFDMMEEEKSEVKHFQELTTQEVTPKPIRIKAVDRRQRSFKWDPREDMNNDLVCDAETKFDAKKSQSQRHLC